MDPYLEWMDPGAEPNLKGFLCLPLHISLMNSISAFMHFLTVRLFANITNLILNISARVGKGD